jgi:glycosyltransferase involved in cell wall biosynthesis
MKLSIIIPVYNTEPYIEQCMLSCLKQDLPLDEYEIIVINDGTKDKSMSIVERIANDNKNIRIISQENKGLSAARNAGLGIAQGKYIWFVDSDDWIEENCVKSLIVKMEQDDLEGLVYAGIRYIEGKTSLGAEVSYSNIVMSGKELMSMHPINCAAVKTIYKKEFLDQNNLRFYEGIYHEDHEFTPRAYYFINRIEFTNDHVYYNRQTPGSITQKPNPKKAFDLVVVARSLYNFKQTHDMENVGRAFDNLIAAAVNQSLSNSYYMDEDNKSMLNKRLEESRYLLDSMSHSSNGKYRIEGILFKLFPKRIVKTYNMIKGL